MSGAKTEAKNVNTITAKPSSNMTRLERPEHVDAVIVAILFFRFIFPTIPTD